jgi:phosphoenolpyruvate synthase/pyruvate phosphate dikinase/spermidine synthase
MKKINLPVFSTNDKMVITQKSVLYQGISKKQIIKIIDTKEFGKCLLINGIMQASEIDHKIYDDQLILNLSKDNSKILILGGGDGFVASTILDRNVSIKKIDIVDIDRKVVNSCQKYFKYNKKFKNKVHFMIKDAVQYLKKNSEKYSAIIIDLTDIPVIKDKNIKSFFEELIELSKRNIIDKGWISIQAGVPNSIKNNLNLKSVLSDIFKKNFNSFFCHQVFVPSFGEASNFLTATKNNSYIFNPKEYKDNNIKVESLGGKGFSLYKMSKIGINIPDFFIIRSELFKDLLVNQKIDKKIRILLEKVKNANFEKINIISSEIIKILNDVEIKNEDIDEIYKYFNRFKFKNVSIRSSAILEDGKENAWAGQLKTFLNINKENIIKSIKKCWMSLYSERALIYMKENNLLNKNIGIAIIIQKMISPDVSGVGFSINPVNGDKNTVIIESIFGLGEYLVNGATTPDLYHFLKTDKKIIKKVHSVQLKKMIINKKIGIKEVNISSQQKNSKKMSDNLYLKLLDQIIKCEKYFKCPQDVEWLLKKGKIYILQSRPITSISDNSIPDFNNYSKIYTAENIFPPLFIDLAIQAKYLPFDGMFLFENYKSTLFIEKESLLRTKEIGKKMLFSYKYITESKKTIKKIKAEIKKIELIINCNLNENIKKIITKYFNLFKLAIYNYSFTECFYTDGAEEKVINEFKKEFKINLNFSSFYDFINKDIKVSKKIKYYLNIFKILGEQKLEFRGIMNNLSTIAEKIFDKISKEFNVNSDFLDFLTLKEFNDFLSLKLTKRSVKTLYDLRSKYFIQKVEKSNITIYQDSEAKDIIDFYKLCSRNDKKVKWEGKGVFAGLYSGVVRKIPYFMDIKNKEYRKYIKNFKKGEILLARSTGPELMSIIKKAGAIISEEGGIMSHAAVVCREFKKPGVVGIPNIFENINDGAIVCVNGQHGLVLLKNNYDNNKKI